MDNGGDGTTDEGSCGGGACESYRTDPVHVGSGVFMTEPAVDGDFAGSTMPLVLVRTYNSMDAWGDVASERTRLGQGWFHTFDERLFDGMGRANPASPATLPAASFAVVHRSSTGRGRRFACPTYTTGSWSCPSSDGSLDALTWEPGTSRWRIDEGTGPRTYFDAQGRMIRRENRAGAAWVLLYDTAGRLVAAADELNRGFAFIWQTFPDDTELDQIVEIRSLSSGATLVTYAHALSGLHLTGVSSARTNETYVYDRVTLYGVEVDRPFLTRVVRDGQDAVTVSYRYGGTGAAADGPLGRGRVASVAAEDGSYVFRYPGAAGNVCPVPSRSTTIIDRSTAPLPASCTVDADCAGSGLAACDSGVCRAVTCNEYEASGGTVVSFGNLINIDGNCPCGGAVTFAYQTSDARSPEAPRRMIASTARDGTSTTYAYDSRGRLAARCEGDAAGTTVTTDPTTCPDTGAFVAFTYHSTWPRLVATETRESRFSGSPITTTYMYDGTTAQMTSRAVQGYTYDATGNAVLETQRTSWTYTGGRLTSVTGPSSRQRTDYVYYPSGSRLNTGMVQHERRYWGLGTSDYLQTTYGSYTELGRPQSITSPAGAVTARTYSFGGLRRDSETVASGILNLTTSYRYTAGGRLQEVIEPTGRRISITYGPFGRPQSINLLDTAGWGLAYDRLQMEYDEAGRRMYVAMQRIDSLGAVVATSSSKRATYEAHGYRASVQLGPQSPTQLSYDSAGLGQLAQFVRGDGDTIDLLGYDAFGREASVVRSFGGGATGTHASTYRNGSAVPEVGADLPVMVTEPSGQTRTYTWDDFGHLVRSVSDEWGTMRWYYVQGRLLQQHDPSGARTDYTYDTLGRITRIDNNAQAQSAMGQDYRFFYDNAPSAVACPTSGGAYRCAYRRGRLGRVQVEHAPGSFWDMLYDYAADGQLGVEQWPDGRQSIYAYDAAGRLSLLIEPASLLESLGYTYDSEAGDAADPTEVVAITQHRFGSPSWVHWGRVMRHDASGQLTSVTTHDAVSTSFPDVFVYRTDGRLASLRVRRRSGSGSVDLVNRTYSYAPDGAVTGFDSTVAADSDRTFLLDQGNRLVCTASAAGSATCPTDSTRVEQLTYSGSDSRTGLTVGTGTAPTSYTSTANRLTSETWTGHTVSYGHTSSRRSSDDDSAYMNDGRAYTYDGLGRLRTVTVNRPFGSSPTVHQHTISIFYDHRSRPVMITDRDDVALTTASTTYYYDRENRLIGRIVTPDMAAPTTYTSEMYVPLDPLLTGTSRVSFVSGSVSSEALFYTANAPEGTPLATYSFPRTGTITSTEVWRGDWGSFGNLRGASGTEPAPPWRFRGQIELAASDAAVWSGGTQLRVRDPLVLNSWRVYDPRVGQYLQPEPALFSGEWTLSHLYAYGRVAPIDYIDPDGLRTIGVQIFGGGAVGLGGWLAGGLYWDIGNSDFGIYGGVAGTIGTSLGAGLGGGLLYTPGGAESLDGTCINVGGGIGPLWGEVSAPPSINPPVYRPQPTAPPSPPLMTGGLQAGGEADLHLGLSAGGHCNIGCILDWLGIY